MARYLLFRNLTKYLSPQKKKKKGGGKKKKKKKKKQK